MVSVDGYTLIYERKKNRIVIILPQTVKTLASTTGAMSNRKLDMTASEEILILNVIKAIMGESDETD